MSEEQHSHSFCSYVKNFFNHKQPETVRETIEDLIEEANENGDDQFTYDIFLRPWGTSWDDAKAEDLPYYYHDWYLPLIEAGEPMPDSIG